MAITKGGFWRLRWPASNSWFWRTPENVSGENRPFRQRHTCDARGSELGVAVPVTPGSAPCPDGFVVQLPSQQDVVQQPQRADRCAELFVGFGLKADALKAGAEMGDQVLSIVRIKAQLKLAMRPMTVPSCS